MLPLLLSLICKQTYSSLVQTASHSLDQQIVKPYSLSWVLLWIFQGLPSNSLWYRWCIQVSYLSLPHHHLAHKLSAGSTSWADVKGFQAGSPSLYGPHPRKACSGGSPIPADVHSAMLPKHLTRVRASPQCSQLEGTQSMLSGHPLSPHTSCRKRGWCRLTAEVSPNKSPYKTCIDAFYTRYPLRVKRIFKRCELGV